jgi:Mg-chelatase subunit ChlD
VIACAVALVLLLDASASIRADEWQMQLDGHAAALESPEVARVIERGGPVAVTAFAFSDDAVPVLPWRVVASAADARAAAQALRQAPRGVPLGTDLPGALRAALRALSAAPRPCEREVVDLVTDGEAAAPVRERAYAEAQGVTVNALAVGPVTAADWLREHAITPGGFVLRAEGWADFHRAILRKLVLELASWTPTSAPD